MPKHVFLRLSRFRVFVVVVVVVVVVVLERESVYLFVCLFLVYCYSTANNRLLHTYYL